MNLTQSVAFADLRRQGVSSLKASGPSATKKSAEQIVSRLFSLAEDSGEPIRDITAAAWQKEWLASERFILLDIPLNKVAVPYMPKNDSKIMGMMRASSDSVEPIIVDVNKKKIGTTTFNSKFYPPVVVVDGKHRYKAGVLQGRQTIRAWVGELAAAKLGFIHADHQLSSSELQGQLSKLLDAQHNTGDGVTPVNWSDRARIVDVYPKEDYFIFEKQDKKYRQPYKCNGREVELSGKPKEVVHKYVNAAAKVSPMEHAMHFHGATGSAGMGVGSHGGAPSQSLSQGSGVPKLPKPMTAESSIPKDTGIPNSAEPSIRSSTKLGKRRTAAGSGYIGYRSASKTMSDKTKGATGSEMFSRLNGQGYSGYSDATETTRAKTKGGTKSEMFDRLKGAAHVKKIVTDYKNAMKAGYKHSKEELQAVAPPGMEHMVKGLKKHFGEDSAAPFKIAWWQHNQDKKKKKND